MVGTASDSIVLWNGRTVVNIITLGLVEIDTNVTRDPMIPLVTAQSNERFLSNITNTDPYLLTLLRDLLATITKLSLN